MSLENYEGTAIDTDVLYDVEPIEASAQDTDVDASVGSEGTPAESSTEETPTTLYVEGIGELTAEEIKEWRSGNLRQSDYTKKTQELARQREELKHAEELYNYLYQNPHLVEALKEVEANPNSVVARSAPTQESRMLMDVVYKQNALELDLKLDALHNKYPDFDDVAVLTRATQLGTEDLEFVYKAIKFDEISQNQNALKEQVKAELKAELESNRGAVTSVVGGKQNSTVTPKVSLTPDQKRVADGMGLSYEEYTKWLG